jgi:hypothetical protein
VRLRLPGSSPPVSVIALLSERDDSLRILRIRCHRRGHCVIEDRPHLDSKARLRQPPMDCLLNELQPEEGGPEICWCRQCRRSHVPGPYGWPAEESSAHQVRSCCKDSWLADGWFCRWSGRDEQTGSEQASWGIYGSGHRFAKKSWVGVNADGTFVNDGSTSIGLRVGLAGWS